MARPARQTSTAPFSCPARLYSSASCANAIDAGSFWTRRRRSSIRGLSATHLRYHVDDLHVRSAHAGIVDHRQDDRIESRVGIVVILERSGPRGALAVAPAPLVLNDGA